MLRRVRKLLDKAAHTANEHESDAFSRKAAELIAAHRIDPSRLASVADELGVAEIELGRGVYVRARLSLLMSVAAANDVQVVFATRPTGTVAMAAGFRRDLAVTESLYHSLHSQAGQMMARRRGRTPAATRRDRRSFLFGFAARIDELLAEASASAERSAATPSANATEAGAGVLPMLAARRARVDEFAIGRFGRVRTARAPAAATADGWHAGAQAADRVDIGRTRLGTRRALGRGSG